MGKWLLIIYLTGQGWLGLPDRVYEFPDYETCERAREQIMETNEKATVFCVPEEKEDGDG